MRSIVVFAIAVFLLPVTGRASFIDNSGRFVWDIQGMIRAHGLGTSEYFEDTRTLTLTTAGPVRPGRAQFAWYAESIGDGNAGASVTLSIGPYSLISCGEYCSF